jgi:hypothetical protein
MDGLNHLQEGDRAHNGFLLAHHVRPQIAIPVT